MKTKHAMIILSSGTEDIEAVTPMDLLRRAGIKVTSVSLDKEMVECSNGTKLVADTCISHISDTPDLLVIPGGHNGATHIARHDKTNALIKAHVKKNALLGSICASPALVLAPLGVLHHKSATCYPGYETHFHETTVFKTDPVVKDGNIITSRGPGTAFQFSLALIEALLGKEASEDIAKKTLYR